MSDFLQLRPASEGLPVFPLCRHIFNPTFDSHLKNDDRLPPSLGGTGSTRPGSPQPSTPVASWLAARLAALVGPEVGRCVRVEENDAQFLLEARLEQVHGLMTITISSSGSTAILVRSSDLTAAQRLYDSLCESLFSRANELREVLVTYPNGVVLGLRQEQLLGSLPEPEADIAAIVDRILEKQSVRRLPDDNPNRCPMTREQILSELNSSRRSQVPLEALRYLQSVDLGNESAWVFRLTRRRSCAVVIVSSTGSVRLECVGW